MSAISWYYYYYIDILSVQVDGKIASLLWTACIKQYKLKNIKLLKLTKNMNHQSNLINSSLSVAVCRWISLPVSNLVNLNCLGITFKTISCFIVISYWVLWLELMLKQVHVFMRYTDSMSCPLSCRNISQKDPWIPREEEKGQVKETLALSEGPWVYIGQNVNVALCFISCQFGFK